MTPAPSLRRALLALLVPVLLVLAGAPSHAAPGAGSGRAADARDVAFVGRVVAVEPYVSGDVSQSVPQGRDYTVDVVATYGAGDLPTESDGERTIVHVLAPSVCPAWPLAPETQRYLFQVTPAETTGKLFARDRCGSLGEYDKSTDEQIVAVYGDKNFVDAVPTSPDAPDPQEISFLCPETGEALPDPSDPAVDCDGLPEPTSTNRAAAPGLALVIVGFLGLVVLRRMGAGSRRVRRA